MANVFTKRVGVSDWIPVVNGWPEDDAMRLMRSILKCRDSNERVAVEVDCNVGTGFYVYASDDGERIHTV